MERERNNRTGEDTMKGEEECFLRRGRGDGFRGHGVYVGIVQF